jgi:hypothetical protein
MPPAKHQQRRVGQRKVVGDATHDAAHQQKAGKFVSTLIYSARKLLTGLT